MSVIWIIVLKEGENSDKTKILEKKLKGIFKIHNINFPIVVDKYGVFNKFEDETEIILIDTPNKIVKNYRFPLSPNEMRGLFMPNNKYTEDKRRVKN